MEQPGAAPNGFMPLLVRVPPAQPNHPLHCVIEFSHGVIIRLSGPVDFDRLAQFIQATAV